MVFSSITFLFFFLPLILGFYYCSGSYKNSLLLLVSLIFYAWGEGLYLLVMLASIVMNYSCGRLMFYSGGNGKPSKIVLALAVGFNLSLLAFFKYANFVADNLNALFAVVQLPTIDLNPVHLPIGISFFTFQAISYIIDIYQGKVEPQKSFVNLGLYISLFPQLIAGPIVRYHDIAKALVKRKVNSDDFSYGIQRFLIGLGKKVLLANPLAYTADKIFALPFTDLSSPVAWLGAVCYTLQIYYDFSGYSDMAIGLGRMFGFRFLENFNFPYISKSIQDFWRRWHISLSSWLRDYLYIPLGGNRQGRFRTSLNLGVVFLLCGLWHGAEWTFVCWGGYHGMFLMLERTGFGQKMKDLWIPLQHSLTLLIIIVGWVLFRSDSLAGAITYIGIMFGVAGGGGSQLFSLYMDNKLSWELAVAVILSIPLSPTISRFKERFIGPEPSKRNVGFELVYETGRLVLLILMTYFTVISLAAGVYNPFIYFRF